VLVSLHQVDVALRYCKRVIAMRDGRVVFDGPSTALNPAFLNELYASDAEAPALPSGPENLDSQPMPLPVAAPEAPREPVPVAA